ncbi:cytochrome b5-like heme/steroid binding protein, putative [Plasmodium vivax]|nr:cytochrome b5-like heme/steroid binding protein, putative [Plasmodium vivax]
MQGTTDADNTLKPINVEKCTEESPCSLRKNVQGANQMLFANLSEGFKNEEEQVEGDEKAIKTFTREEVAKHNTSKDAWVIYKNKIYEITYYLLYHPGGEDILAEQAGNDITDYVFQYHPWVNVERILEHTYKGDVAE